MYHDLLLPLALTCLALCVGCPTTDYETTTCEEVCPGVITADCDEGPATEQDCIDSCNDSIEGDCGDEHQALIDCFQATGMTCEDGDLVGEDCNAEEDAWDTCSGTT